MILLSFIDYHIFFVATHYVNSPIPMSPFSNTYFMEISTVLNSIIGGVSEMNNNWCLMINFIQWLSVRTTISSSVTSYWSPCLIQISTSYKIHPYIQGYVGQWGESLFQFYFASRFHNMIVNIAQQFFPWFGSCVALNQPSSFERNSNF